MNNVNFMIDFIQNSKRQFVNATVTDERIKLGLNNFVDKQTELCKIITKNIEDFTKIALENHKVSNICKP
jgi:energy-coupling factor transporter ATP-binding protein EcfA2